MRNPYKYLKDEGLFGWNCWHLIKHPWIVPKDAYLRVKWFIQRGYRGYADCDAWSLDHYLSKWLPEAIRRLKGGPGFPVQVYIDLFGETGLEVSWPEENCTLAHKQWQEIIEKISLGFEAARKIGEFDYTTREECINLENITNTGLSLFSKYYLNLWD